jgi:oxaloacetate decarboxylase gamma subunit
VINLERLPQKHYSYPERFYAASGQKLPDTAFARSVTTHRKEHTVSLEEQGLVLMIVGMSVVLTFLIILVYSTKALSAIVNKYSPEKEIPVKVRRQAVSGSVDTEIAAAVAAAAAYSQR